MTRREQIEQVAHLIKGKSRNREFIAFVQGALWADAHLWKSADGDDLPEIDREVVVFTQTERQYPKVAIAHTIPMGDWKQFDGNRYYLERNGEVGWSLPDVKWWLDCKMPYKEGGEE